MISLFGKNEPEPTLLEKLKASVTKTKAVLSETVDTIFQGEKKIDASLLKQLEDGTALRRPGRAHDERDSRVCPRKA